MKTKIVIIFSALAIGFILFLVISSNNKSRESIVELKVNVSFADKKIEIRNQDTTDIIHAELAINEYYKIRDINIKAGEPYTIYQVEFLHHNGKHFPANNRPVQFSIWGELNNGKKGYYHKKLR